MKSIIRCAYDRVILDQLSIFMSTRDNIIRLVSLVHSQMSAKIFQGLVRYAWHASGYVDSHPGVFKTVDECASIYIQSLARPRTVINLLLSVAAGATKSYASIIFS